MRSFFTCLIIMTSIVSKAQKDTTIVVNLEHKKFDKKKKKVTGEENTIKIAPLGFISGVFPVYGERVISDFFTVQAGVGVTSRNYIRNTIQSIDDNQIQPTYPWSQNSGLYDLAAPALEINTKNGLPGEQSRKASLGYLFSIQPRIYFESDAPSGSYLGLSMDYYRYNFSLKALQYNAPNGEYMYTGSLTKEHENITDLMVYFGYQEVYDRISIDFFSGIGLRNVKGSKYYYAEDITQSPALVIEGLAPYKQTLFNYNLGVRVGYHF